MLIYIALKAVLAPLALMPLSTCTWSTYVINTSMPRLSNSLITNSCLENSCCVNESGNLTHMNAVAIFGDGHFTVVIAMFPGFLCLVQAI